MMEKLHLQEGMLVILKTLEDECFIGNIFHLNRDRTAIDLNNVEDFHSKTIIPGVQKFYKSEIKSLNVLSVPAEEEEDEEKDQITEDDQNCDESANSSGSDSKDPSHLTIDDLKRIDKLMDEMKFIIQTDVTYHNAIKDIQSQDIIGLSVEGDQQCRYSRTSVLSISTRDRIYCFDIISLGKIHPELKTILESKTPRKIVYNSSRTADNLKYKQDVHLNSIFDIMVAHNSLGFDKKSITLKECILTHFNLPLVDDHPTINWAARPLTNDSKRIATENIAYLYELYSYLLHDKMLKSFYESCQEYANCYRKTEDSVEVVFELTTSENNSLANVESFRLDVSDSSMDNVES